MFLIQASDTEGEGTKLRAEFVNPFVESIYDLFRTMLSAKIVRTGLAITEGRQMPHEMMALNQDNLAVSCEGR